MSTWSTEVPEAAKPRKVQIGTGQPEQMTAPQQEQVASVKLPDQHYLLKRNAPETLGGVLLSGLFSPVRNYWANYRVFSVTKSYRGIGDG
jgi:hypothetical protein